MKYVSYVRYYMKGTLLKLHYSIPAGKIQVSNTTNMILDMQGGFITVERGGVEIKVKPHFWDTATCECN